MPLYNSINQENPREKPILTDVEAVKQSGFNILNTDRGERFFRPDIGADLEDPIFSLLPKDEQDSGSFKLAHIAELAIKRHEPRLIVDLGKTRVAYLYHENAYDLILAYKVLGLSREYESLRTKIGR
jgi:phage baseplate assembly protein W